MHTRVKTLCLLLSVALIGCQSKNANTPTRTTQAPKSEAARAREEAPLELAEKAQQPVGRTNNTAEYAPEASRDASVVADAKIRLAAPAVAAAPTAPPIPQAGVIALPEPNTETYAALEPSQVKQTAVEPVSTFSIDVDTGAYTNTRSLLRQGQLPPADAIRAEEFINAFDYAYQAPKSRQQPFSVTTELSASPWNADRQLLLVGLQGYRVDKSELPPANLVFLLDVSGSMADADKLPLLKSAFAHLVENLSSKDRVSIVVYAGAAGVVLEPTPGDQKDRILAALEQLQAGGSTNGGEGIELAYRLANANLIQDGVNRIILATDGDFNVGNFSQDALKNYVAKQRETGVSLSTLGFGRGNYNDAMAEQLANVGNGNHAYIDSVKEAERVLGSELSGTLFTIAQDVKIQIEFNPAQVAEYRLIGYENRALAAEDFNNDRVDAGEIGAGHSVTAIYEIARPNAKSLQIDPSRYQTSTLQGKTGAELGYLKLRYKLPGQSKSRLISQALDADKMTLSPRLSTAAAVAGFAEALRGGKYLGDWDYTQLLTLASAQRGPDPRGQRAELIELMQTAAALSGKASQTAVISQ